MKDEKKVKIRRGEEKGKEEGAKPDTVYFVKTKQKRRIIST